MLNTNSSHVFHASLFDEESKIRLILAASKELITYFNCLYMPSKQLTEAGSEHTLEQLY
jgi:hypothetical protein